jgi:arylsulfatase A
VTTALRSGIRFALLWTLVGALCAAERRPNILFILTDDQGWPTLSSYGNTRVATPHLDSLARDGVRFTAAYVMPQCTPTRSALLSGQHTARNGMWHVIPWYASPWAPVSEPAYREQFPRDGFNLAKGLRAAGYATGMAGKWHLTSGADGDYAALKPSAGAAYGFDFVAPRGPGTQNEGDKWVDHLTDQAIGYIEQQRERPWFFYLAHHTIHSAVSAPPALVAKYRARGAPEKGMHSAVYLACIEHLDNSVGRLLARLNELKLRESTMVVFLSDNGGFDTSWALPAWSNDPSDGSVPLKVREEQFDNAPLRSGKGTAYEGGIRVPCLVRWPGVARAGHVSAEPIHVVDWVPTLLAAAGAPAPAGYVLDGVDLRPALAARALPARPLFWYMPLYDLRWAATPSAVIREGDWKLIEHFGDSFDGQLNYRLGRKLELFNLRTDLGETDDRAAADPARAARMSAHLHAWLKSIPAAIPGPNPHTEVAKRFVETKEKQPWNR